MCNGLSSQLGLHGMARPLGQLLAPADEAVVGLPFPHGKTEKDYSGEVTQGQHRHPTSLRHFLFRLFLWGLHEGHEATYWLHRVTSDLRPLDVQEDTPGWY